MLRIFVEYSSDEKCAYHTLVNQLLLKFNGAVQIIPLRRNSSLSKFSDFKMRFLIPYLCRYTGHALYIDVNLVLLDSFEISLEYFNSKKHAYCLPPAIHDLDSNLYSLGEPRQEMYQASLMFFNNKKCKHLTLEFLKIASFHELYTFDWLLEKELGFFPQNIGVHYFINGSPWFYVLGRIKYSELWYARMHKAQSPYSVEHDFFAKVPFNYIILRTLPPVIYRNLSDHNFYALFDKSIYPSIEADDEISLASLHNFTLSLYKYFKYSVPVSEKLFIDTGDYLVMECDSVNFVYEHISYDQFFLNFIGNKDNLSDEDRFMLVQLLLLDLFCGAQFSSWHPSKPNIIVYGGLYVKIKLENIERVIDKTAKFILENHLIEHARKFSDSLSPELIRKLVLQLNENDFTKDKIQKIIDWNFKIMFLLEDKLGI